MGQNCLVIPYWFYGYVKREKDEKVGKLLKYLLEYVKDRELETPLEISDLVDDFFEALAAFDEEYDVHIANCR